MFCLMPEAVNRFKAKLIDGTINPEKIATMTSEERRAFFTKIVGKDAAKEVNASFESKLLLKNQQRGFISWANKVAGMNPTVKRDLMSRIQRMDHVLAPEEEKMFLKDLAETKLGFSVTHEEATTIAKLANKVTETESKMKPDFTFPSETDRLAHGMAKVQLENFVSEAKLAIEKVSWKNPVLKAKDLVRATPGVLKSTLSSLDNSFFGRQGIKTLLNVRTSNIWIKGFVKSWGDIARQLKGTEAIDLIKADIYSRPNALNGKYNAGGYRLNALTEEAYPSAAPEKIPLLGRLFKASEAAYNGAALRMRADLADKYIRIAEKQGINTLDRKEAQGIGTLIGGITGRGSLGVFEPAAGHLNVLLFSVKFLKANFDTLTLHTLDSKATAFTKREAAKNLATIVASVGSILTVAHTLNPNSVDLDPRSANFGKIKVFGHWTDVTGGLGALTTLAARTLVPTQHNGQWGLWEKTSSGTYNKLNDAQYGKSTALDVFNNFWEGKLAPVLGVVRDVWSGKTYSGQKPTLVNELKGVTTPISIQTFNQLKDSSNADRLGSMLADFLGFSVSTNLKQKVDWTNNPTTETEAFRKAVSPADFKKANAEYNQKLMAAEAKITSDPRYKAMPDSLKTATMTGVKTKIQKEVFNEYHYKYKKQKANPNDTRAKKEILSQV